MVELIALIILVISFGGIVWILARKIPVLVQMPEVEEGIQKENIISILKKRIKKLSLDKVILLKILSKIRVLVLKIEKYVDGSLQKMRKKVHTQKQEEKQAEPQADKKEEKNPPTDISSTLPPSVPE